MPHAFTPFLEILDGRKIFAEMTLLTATKAGPSAFPAKTRRRLLWVYALDDTAGEVLQAAGN